MLSNTFKAYLMTTMAGLLGLWASCDNHPAAYQYCSTPIEGWEPGDTLKYKVDTLKASGVYDFSLGVRTSSSTPYPYQSLWVVVYQQWHNPEQTMVDTVKLQLTNEWGDPQGHGVTLYQFDQPWRKLPLVKGQWADIRITHIMRSEMLRGVSDVGICLQKE